MFDVREDAKLKEWKMVTLLTADSNDSLVPLMRICIRGEKVRKHK